MAFRLAYLYFTLSYSEGQAQGHEHWTANISKMIRDKSTITIVIKHEVAVGAISPNLFGLFVTMLQ